MAKSSKLNDRSITLKLCDYDTSDFAFFIIFFLSLSIVSNTITVNQIFNINIVYLYWYVYDFHRYFHCYVSCYYYRHCHYHYQYHLRYPNHHRSHHPCHSVHNHIFIIFIFIIILFIIFIFIFVIIFIFDIKYISLLLSFIFPIHSFP